MHHYFGFFQVKFDRLKIVYLICIKIKFYDEIYTLFEIRVYGTEKNVKWNFYFTL